MTRAHTAKIGVAATVAVATFAAGTFAYANHAWSKYHWNLSYAQMTASPLVLSENLTTPEWEQSLLESSNKWNVSTVIKTQVRAGSKDSTTCTPTVGQVEVCNAAYGDNGWLGIAQVWAYRGKDQHIAQAVTMLNDTYFNLPQYSTQAWRNLVMCQEVGHTFGLAHQDENFANANLGSCMDYTSDPTGLAGTNGTFNNEWPNAHDYEMLATIYAHQNTTTSGGGTNPGKGKPVATNAVTDPAQWGQAIAQDAQGKNSVYVRNLENGMQLITHVLWVPGEGEHNHDEHEHTH